MLAGFQTCLFRPCIQEEGPEGNFQRKLPEKKRLPKFVDVVDTLERPGAEIEYRVDQFSLTFFLSHWYFLLDQALRFSFSTNFLSLLL